MSEVICRLKPDSLARAQPGRVDPEDLAIKALAFLAEDEERLGRFLAVSGIASGAIRAAAEMPGFFLGLLDYVVADERLVLGLAEHADVRPEAVLRTRDALAPQDDFAIG